MYRFKTTLRLYSQIFLILSLFAVSACSTTPVTEDQPPQLRPGQGIAALIINGNGIFTDYVLKPVSGGGKELHIPSSPVGYQLFLFVTNAGKYCMNRFRVGHSYVIAKRDDQCFDVAAGKLSYGGVFTPYEGWSSSKAWYIGGMSRDNNWALFWKLLRSNFPKIAASTYASQDFIPPTTKSVRKKYTNSICDMFSIEDAEMLLGMSVSTGKEMSIYAYRSCNYVHSENKAVHVAVNEDGTKEIFQHFTVSNPADGWSDWAPIDGLGREAKITSKGDILQLAILIQNKIVFITVEGSLRTDIMTAMRSAAKIFLTNLQRAGYKM
jgi:hypothetical protein